GATRGYLYGRSGGRGVGEHPIVVARDLPVTIGVAIGVAIGRGRARRRAVLVDVGLVGVVLVVGRKDRGLLDAGERIGRVVDGRRLGRRSRLVEHGRRQLQPAAARFGGAGRGVTGRCGRTSGGVRRRARSRRGRG